MSQLGVAPLLIYGGVAAGSAAAGAGATLGIQTWWERFGQYRTSSILELLHLKDPPSIPTSPSPAATPPAAPQTAAKLATWSPDDLWEVTVQRSQQYAQDMDFMRTAGANQPLVSPLPGDRTADSSRFWLLAGIGVVAVVLLVRR